MYNKPERWHVESLPTFILEGDQLDNSQKPFKVLVRKPDAKFRSKILHRPQELPQSEIL